MTTGALQLAFNSQEERQALLKVFDRTGKLILQERRALTEGFNQMILPVPNLAPGMYFLRMEDKDQAWYKPFVVQ